MKNALRKFWRAVHFMSSITVQIKRLEEQRQEPMGNEKYNYYHSYTSVCYSVLYKKYTSNLFAQR